MVLITYHAHYFLFRLKHDVYNIPYRMDFFRETLDALRVEHYGSHCSKKFTTIAVSSLNHSTSEKVVGLLL